MRDTLHESNRPPQCTKRIHAAESASCHRNPDLQKNNHNRSSSTSSRQHQTTKASKPDDSTYAGTVNFKHNDDSIKSAKPNSDDLPLPPAHTPLRNSAPTAAKPRHRSHCPTIPNKDNAQANSWEEQWTYMLVDNITIENSHANNPRRDTKTESAATPAPNAPGRDKQRIRHEHTHSRTSRHNTGRSFRVQPASENSNTHNW